MAGNWLETLRSERSRSGMRNRCVRGSGSRALTWSWAISSRDSAVEGCGEEAAGLQGTFGRAKGPLMSLGARSTAMTSISTPQAKRPSRRSLRLLVGCVVNGTRKVTALLPQLPDDARFPPLLTLRSYGKRHHRDQHRLCEHRTRRTSGPMFSAGKCSRVFLWMSESRSNGRRPDPRIREGPRAEDGQEPYAHRYQPVRLRPSTSGATHRARRQSASISARVMSRGWCLPTRGQRVLPS